ncbi:MAG: hypothetical protein QOF76_2597 [Solirubrobacteraceae bacterium]|nr:hypothetical protein [Solirubrobacteraceae bacterium]
MTAVAARLVRNPTFWLWLPVLVIPPLLVLNAGVGEHDPGTDITVLGVLSAFVACLPLVLRRRLGFFQLAPILTAGIVLVLWALDPGDMVTLIPAVALSEIANRRDRRYVLWTAVFVTPCVMVSIAPYADDGSEFVTLVLRNLAYCWLALAAGDAARSRREAVERTAAAAEEGALRRLGEERLRIARDVHDVVAHAMVAINVQAGVAAHLIDRDPDQARSALREIKAASGEALTDLRATLGVLRDRDASPPIDPTTGVGDFEDLATGLRAAGVTVTFEVEPPPVVPAAVGAAAYRIVQEALTNALRHASPTAVTVRVAGDGDALAIEVVNDGAARPAGAGGGSGNGVRGMQERAVALGGSLEAHAVGGGWRVAARLPLGVRTTA